MVKGALRTFSLQGEASQAKMKLVIVSLTASTPIGHRHFGVAVLSVSCKFCRCPWGLVTATHSLTVTGVAGTTGMREG